jgi:hypothetical protein
MENGNCSAEDTQWIYPNQDGLQRLALPNMLMNLQFPQKAWNVLTTQPGVNLSRTSSMIHELIKQFSKILYIFVLPLALRSVQSGRFPSGFSITDPAHLTLLSLSP